LKNEEALAHGGLLLHKKINKNLLEIMGSFTGNTLSLCEITEVGNLENVYR